MEKRFLTEENYQDIIEKLEKIEANKWGEGLMHSLHGYETEAVTAAMARRDAERAGMEYEMPEDLIVLTKSESESIAKALGVENTKEAICAAAVSAALKETPIKG
jgi:hypothetical protein